jgi:hypothetical protein
MRIIIAMLLLVSVATAQEYRPSTGYGIGISTCGTFAEGYRKFDPKLIEDSYFHWATGFMMGLNTEATANQIKQSVDVVQFRDLTAKSKSDQQAYLRKYCNDHPLAKYSDAVMGLFFLLPVATLKR